MRSILPIRLVALAAASLLILPEPARAEEPIIHPLCVQQLAAMVDFHFQPQVDAPLPAADCNRSFSSTPVDIQGDVASAEIAGTSEVRPPFYEYRVAGRHEGVALLDIAEGTGGTGIFSALVFVEGWPEGDLVGEDVRLRQVGVLEGGDRCNGGIAEVSIDDRSVLRLGERLTPFDLFIFRPARAIRKDRERGFYEAIENPSADLVSPRLMALEPYQDLDTAAASCIGAATTEFDLDAGTARLVSITVTGLIDDDPEWVARHRHQACFNRVVKNAVPVFPKTLTPQQVKAMSETFETECLR